MRQVKFGAENEVSRLTDPPRPSKPYSASEWQAISDLAYEIDHDLSDRDVRLTMGASRRSWPSTIETLPSGIWMLSGHTKGSLRSNCCFVFAIIWPPRGCFISAKGE